MPAEEGPAFVLGLTMAGAISAGAYTGGVLDVLLEALDLHNARYERWRETGETEDDEGPLPRHRVVLKVISGTSAGGMSAGLAVAGLIGARRMVDGKFQSQIAAQERAEFTSPSGYSYSYGYTLKPLHNCWVALVDLWRQAPGRKAEGLLAQDDLEDREDGTKKPVLSVLNSEHIDRQVEAELGQIKWTGRAPYRFLASDFEVFLTTTNLQGVPYAVQFDTEGSHVMAQHSAVRHFRITGLGAHQIPSAWLDTWLDDGIELKVPDSDADIPFIGPDDSREGWARFTRAAIATGAFPVGLASRTIDGPTDEFGLALPARKGRIRGGALPISMHPILAGDGDPIDFRPRPVFAGAEDADVNYVAVDGGVINNEPFELARYTLRERADGAAPGESYLKANPRGADEADRAIIMIDPFPEGPVYSPMTRERAEEGRGILTVAKQLLPALIGQARFKPGELMEAATSTIHSRFLISPKRPIIDAFGKEVEAVGAKAIASGCFGGFGGFFDRAFRAHDFMLGQRNAQRFLQRRLAVGANNPVLNGGSAVPIEGLVPVIQPGRSFFAREYPRPDWPRIGRAELIPIFKAAQERIARLGGKVLESSRADTLTRWALQRVWSGLPLVSGADKKVSFAVRSTVLTELIDRDQLHDFRRRRDGQPYTAWQRHVLVTIAKSGTTPVPVMPADDDEGPGLAAVYREKVGPGEETPSLDDLRWFLEDEEANGHLWKAPARRGGDDRYTLMDLKPPRVAGMAISSGISRVRSWFG